MLNELCNTLNNASYEEIQDIDLSDLPTFGGEEPADTRGVWSWDEKNLLVSDTRRGRGFIVVPRG